jgi:hypothetical protein
VRARNEGCGSESSLIHSFDQIGFQSLPPLALVTCFFAAPERRINGGDSESCVAYPRVNFYLLNKINRAVAAAVDISEMTLPLCVTVTIIAMPSFLEFFPLVIQRHCILAGTGLRVHRPTNLCQPPLGWILKKLFSSAGGGRLILGSFAYCCQGKNKGKGKQRTLIQ